MTKAKFEKAITKLAEIMEVSREQVASDLAKKNPVRWYMVEEIAKTL
jgi:hypothetical protein